MDNNATMPGRSRVVVTNLLRLIAGCKVKPQSGRWRLHFATGRVVGSGGVMPKRTSHQDATCTVARPLDAIGDGWSLLIVRDAFDGLRRFGEFQRNLGLARNILSARLHSLVDHGALTTVPAADGSPYQEYVLTARGGGLSPVRAARRQWSDEHFSTPPEPRSARVARDHGQPLARIEVRAADGRVVGPEDTTVVTRP